MIVGACHLRESFCLAQVQFAEHATSKLLHNDQFITWKLFQLNLVVHKECVKVTVRVELMI